MFDKDKSSIILNNMNSFYSGRMDCHRHSMYAIIKHYNRKVSPLFLERDSYIDYDGELMSYNYQIMDVREYYRDMGLDFIYPHIEEGCTVDIIQDALT